MTEGTVEPDSPDRILGLRKIHDPGGNHGERGFGFKKGGRSGRGDLGPKEKEG